MQWNVIEGEVLYVGDSGSAAVAAPTLAFNTLYGTSFGTGSALLLLNGGGTISTAYINNNVLIATTGGTGFGIHGNAVTGAGFMFEKLDR